jgi:hypothetical protein
MGEWRYSFTILNFGSRLDEGGQLHAPVALPRDNSPWYPLDRGLGGPQSRSGRYGEDTNLLLLPEIDPRHLGLPACSRKMIPDTSAFQPVA